MCLNYNIPIWLMTTNKPKVKTMLQNNIKKITQYNYFISKEEVEKATGKKGKSEKGTMVVFKQNGELKELNIADYKKLELKQ